MIIIDNMGMRGILKKNVNEEKADVIGLGW